jgi:CRP-like cAMP-binding protein
MIMIDTSSIRLFEGLGKAEISVILAAATRRNVKKSEIVASTDQVSTYLFLVKAGCLNCYVVTNDGRRILLRRLIPGNVFGLGSFLSEPMNYIGTAQAVANSEILMWEHRLVRHLSRAYPRFGENALRSSLRCLALYAKRHMALISSNAQERLAYVLTSLASGAGRTLPEGVEIEINNEDLASLADISFFTASRILKRWEHKGAVKKSRGKILISHPEKILAA